MRADQDSTTSAHRLRRALLVFDDNSFFLHRLLIQSCFISRKQLLNLYRQDESTLHITILSCRFCPNTFDRSSRKQLDSKHRRRAERRSCANLSAILMLSFHHRQHSKQLFRLSIFTHRENLLFSHQSCKLIRCDNLQSYAIRWLSRP